MAPSTKTNCGPFSLRFRDCALTEESGLGPLKTFATAQIPSQCGRDDYGAIGLLVDLEQGNQDARRRHEGVVERVREANST